MGSRRRAGLVAVLVSHALVLGFAALFYTRARVTVLAAFREFDTELPGSAAVALSPWFLPATAAIGVGATAAGLLLPLRRSRRMGLCAIGLVVSSFALVFAVLAAFLPVFRPAG